MEGYIDYSRVNDSRTHDVINEEVVAMRTLFSHYQLGIPEPFFF